MSQCTPSTTIIKKAKNKTKNARKLRPYLKITRTKRAGGVAQAVE
jgi:hypothetical protein